MSGRMSAPGTSCSKETVLRVGLEGKIKHCYAFGVPALGQRSNMCARCDYSGRKRNFFEGPVTFKDIGFFIRGFQCDLLLDAKLNLLRPCKPFCSRSICWWDFSLEQVDISRTYQVTSLLLGRMDAITACQTKVNGDSHSRE